VLSGVLAPAVPAAHAAAATLDARVTRQAPAARPLVTRITSAPAQKSYTVVSGDTLSGIAGRFCGNPGAWPVIWHASQAAVPDPDRIYPGQVLTLTCQELAAAAQAPAGPPASGKTYGVSYGDPNYCGDGDGDGWDVKCPGPAAVPQAKTAAAPVAAIAGVSGVLSTAGMSAFEQCVIARESGGNAQAVNPASDAGGLFQFLPGTWAALGFAAQYPGGAQTAPVSVQEAAFARAFAQSGTSPWAPYDGC